MDLADDPTVVVRSATTADAARVTATLTRAFLEDPVWGSYLRDDDGSQAGAAVWWRFCVDEAVRYPWVKMTPGYEAVSVWIPPGGTEIAHEHDDLVEPLLLSLFGRARTDDLLEVFERFESSHPHEAPHYYLSLLGTHPDARGQGLGMRLAAAVLDQIDAEQMPAYLESSNPALERRSIRAGRIRAVRGVHPPEWPPSDHDVASRTPLTTGLVDASGRNPDNRGRNYTSTSCPRRDAATASPSDTTPEARWPRPARSSPTSATSSRSTTTSSTCARPSVV